jgi:hypothetical protein
METLPLYNHIALSVDRQDEQTVLAKDFWLVFDTIHLCHYSRLHATRQFLDLLCGDEIETFR